MLRRQAREATAKSLRGVRRALQLGASALRLRLLRWTYPGLRVKGKVFLGPGCDVVLAPGSKVQLSSVHISPRVTIAAGPGATIVIEDSFVGPGAVLAAQQDLRVGQGTKIAEMVVIRDANHDHTAPLREMRFRSSPVDIGRDVWLGAGSIVLAGAHVGDGATVGAGAVVTGDVPPGATVVGVPARPIPGR